MHELQIGLYFIITTFLQDIFVVICNALEKIYQLEFLASRTNFPIAKRKTEIIFEN